MRIEPEISGVRVVLLGQFNPAIFTPAWFAMHAILPTNIEANAKLQIVHPQLDPEGRPKGGRINVTVEPSNQIGQGRAGVYVRVNDHYSINDSGPGALDRLMELFEKDFETSLRRSDGLIDHIMSLAASRKV